MNTRRTCFRLFTVVFALAASWPARSARAQGEVTPLSVTKLRVLSPETVPEKRMEVGLLWEMGWYHRRFDHRGKIINPRLLSTRAELGMRLIFGILDTRKFGIEMGIIVPVAFEWSKNKETNEKLSATGMGDIPFGLKFRFLSKPKASLAWVMAVTVPTGNEAAGLSDGFTDVATGFVFSSQALRWLSIDYNLTAGVTVGIDPEDKDEVPRLGLVNKLGFAWLLPRDVPVMPCFEFAYLMNHTPEAPKNYRFSHELVMNLGLNIQLNSRVIIMQAAQWSLAGSNVHRGAMWFMSFMFLT